MSENETTFEDKIFAYALLGFCAGLGYCIRSPFGISIFLQDFEQHFILLDGLIRIISIGLGVFILIGVVLIHIDRRKAE